MPAQRSSILVKRMDEEREEFRQPDRLAEDASEKARKKRDRVISAFMDGRIDDFKRYYR